MRELPLIWPKRRAIDALGPRLSRSSVPGVAPEAELVGNVGSSLRFMLLAALKSGERMVHSAYAFRRQSAPKSRMTSHAASNLLGALAARRNSLADGANDYLLVMGRQPVVGQTQQPHPNGTQQ